MLAWSEVSRIVRSVRFDKGARGGARCGGFAREAGRAADTSARETPLRTRVSASRRCGQECPRHAAICGIVFRAGGWDGLGAMTSVSSDSLVVFQIGEQQFAVGLTAVERVLRAVKIAPLPDAPPGVRGVINLQGRIVPVFDLWARFGHPARALRVSDHLLIARTHWRTVALLVDAVTGVVPRGQVQVTPAEDILPDLESISGVMKLDGGLVLVHDVERFLSIEDHAALQLALNLEA